MYNYSIVRVVVLSDLVFTRPTNIDTILKLVTNFELYLTTNIIVHEGITYLRDVIIKQSRQTRNDNTINVDVSKVAKYKMPHTDDVNF